MAMEAVEVLLCARTSATSPSYVRKGLGTSSPKRVGAFGAVAVLIVFMNGLIVGFGIGFGATGTWGRGGIGTVDVVFGIGVTGVVFTEIGEVLGIDGCACISSFFPDLMSWPLKANSGSSPLGFLFSSMGIL